MINLVPGNPIWKKNYEALQRRFYDLACRLSEIPFPSQNIKAVSTPDNSLILCLKSKNDSWIPLDDPQSPQQNSQEWILSLGEKFLCNSHVMLIGFGTGYHALNLYKLSRGFTYIWIVEPNLEVLKAAFHFIDFTHLLSSPYIFLSGGMPEEQVARQLFNGVTSNRMRAQGIRMVCSPGMKKEYENYINNMAVSINNTVKMEEMKFKSTEIQGLFVLKNISANLPYILNGAPVLRLMGIAAGMPAVIIGPGPSLEEALPLIHANDDKFVIITIDTALPILQRHGIRSDLIISLDFTPMNARYFENMVDAPGILVASPAIDTKITKLYQGRTFFFSHNAVKLCSLLSSLGPLGELKAYSSTTHASVHAARLMGCSPILLVGIDLSYRNRKRYASETVPNMRNNDDSQPSNFIEIPANNGSMVSTTPQFMMHQKALVQLIHETAAVVINTSFQGAKIPGCEYHPFDKLVQTFETGLNKQILQDALNPSLEYQRKELLAEMKVLSAHSRAVSQIIDRLVQDTQLLNPDFEGFCHEMKTMYKTFFQLHQREPDMFTLCSSLCPRAIVAFFGEADETVMYGGESPRDRLQAKKRLLKYLNEFKRALIIVSYSLTNPFHEANT